jgi:type 1 glutamine amidotransferase
LTAIALLLFFSNVSACWPAAPWSGHKSAAGFTTTTDEDFKSIFDGKSLEGWQGDPNIWRVEDGSIVGETTADNPIADNVFLTWRQGELDDFVLRLKFRISGDETANSGVQIRSQSNEVGRLSGYQADIHKAGRYMGIIYDENGERGILADRGHRVVIDRDGNRDDNQTSNPDQSLKQIDLENWNEYEIEAHGQLIRISINGHLMSEIEDHQADHFDRSGLLGLQVHVGTPMKVQFKDIRLKRLPLSMDEKKIVFIAGQPSHGWGEHEHNAGCLLLADRLNAAARDAGLAVLTTVYRNGWPQDPTALDNADSVVVYCDGGQGHMLHEHGEAFEKIIQRGVGLVCIHYGVEVPKGISGQRFLQWIGGYFETDWSVNPHWNAKFDGLPDHPITRGVKPFEINDEWYYHMRFSPDMTRVQPILTAIPPDSTLNREDGPHSGNPHVRQAIKERRPQHLAWAFVRGDGKGRGFGFTGGHFHRNWKDDNFRKTLLNAIAWTAHVDVPATGIESKTPTEDELLANQDEPKPSK